MKHRYSEYSRCKKSYRNDSTLYDSEADDSDTHHIDSISVDYRSKTFDLMKRNASIEMMLKQSQRNVASLQTQVEELNGKIQEIFEVFGISYRDLQGPQKFNRATSQMQQLLRKVYRLRNDEQTSFDKSQKQSSFNQCLESQRCECNCEQQYDELINQYKNIIETQHKSHANKCKKYEQQLASLQEQNRQLQQQKNSLKLDTDIKIANLKDLLSEEKILLKKFDDQNKSLMKEKESIARKYQKEIQSFEEMERIVEEKLIQVEQQMNFYKKQRVEQIKKIAELQKQLYGKSEQENYYSFGEKHKEAQTQTDQSGDHLQAKQSPRKGEQGDGLSGWQQECYQQSIRTLLMENKRLKNALFNLNQSRISNKQLNQATQLQLKILMSSFN